MAGWNSRSSCATLPAWEVRYGARVIASMKYGDSPGKESAQFGSAIICRKDASGIRQLSDLRGKRVIVFTESTMGWAAAWREFADLGIDPRRDFAELRFGSTLAEPGALAVVDAFAKEERMPGCCPAGFLSGWRQTMRPGLGFCPLRGPTRSPRGTPTPQHQAVSRGAFRQSAPHIHRAGDRGDCGAAEHAARQ